MIYLDTFTGNVVQSRSNFSSYIVLKKENGEVYWDYDETYTPYPIHLISIPDSFIYYDTRYNMIYVNYLHKVYEWCFLSTTGWTRYHLNFSFISLPYLQSECVSIQKMPDFTYIQDFARNILDNQIVDSYLTDLRQEGQIRFNSNQDSIQCL